MKKISAFGLIWLLLTLWFLWHTPEDSARILTVEVIALEDVPESRGLRRITVRFEDGRERIIETLVPFFFKVGYKARVAVHERYLFPDVYRIISDSEPIS